MRAISKDMNNIPASLFDGSVPNNLNQVNKHIYATKEVKERLNLLYYKKCAYCEDTLLNHFKHIDHYRPKKNYYWLAYSWDNLVLCCENCNVNKGTHFKIRNKQKQYDGETLFQLQTMIKIYDKQENPELINPEQETNFSHHLKFNFNGQIEAKTQRMQYTIDTLKLNRDDLVELRLIILNELRNEILKCITKFTVIPNYDFVGAIKELKEKFAAKTTISSTFTAWRLFILENFTDFTKMIVK